MLSEDPLLLSAPCFVFTLPGITLGLAICESSERRILSLSHCFYTFLHTSTHISCTHDFCAWDDLHFNLILANLRSIRTLLDQYWQGLLQTSADILLGSPAADLRIFAATLCMASPCPWGDMPDDKGTSIQINIPQVFHFASHLMAKLNGYCAGCLYLKQHALQSAHQCCS